jgi:hypothetical protein
MRHFLVSIFDKFNYRDPLKWAVHVVNMRTDQGVDYLAAKGSLIRAMGNCQITRATTNSGWPGGGCVQYRLTGPGSHKGEEVYIAEFIKPLVFSGQWVKKGDAIAKFTADFSSGVGIETGWVRRGTNEPCNPCMPDNANCGQTEGGRAFARWLHQLGRPTRDDPGAGDTHCPC